MPPKGIVPAPVMENYKRLAIAALLTLVLGGCRVDATVEARVHETGGTVSARFVLDREAVALIGGAVGEGAQKSDLQQAGWEISPVRTTDDGGAEVEVTKQFSRAGDLGVVVAELAGPAGPLRDFHLDRRRSFTETSFRLRGTADVGAGWAAATGFPNAPDLPARLRDAGVDPERVEELLAGRAVDGLHFRLVVELPGAEEQTFELRPGSPVTVDVSSKITDRTRPVLLAVAILTGSIVLFRLRRRTPQS
ncbi:MAG TPA: hypothetical protein VEG38_19055 [Acidimicrobiia bacterium]|nr:hypothetical protein [Acidimicrobiia bacterium]